MKLEPEFALNRSLGSGGRGAASARLAPAVLLASIIGAALLIGCASRSPDAKAETNTTATTSAAPDAPARTAPMTPVPPEPSSAQPTAVSTSAPQGPTAPVTARPAGLVEIFPGVRVDRAGRVVEFDAVVPIDPRDETTPVIYLEVIACPRDTKEHEALLVTSVKPSQVHAALLLIGLVPGAPGRVGWKDNAPVRISPTGPAVDIVFRFDDPSGKTIEARPQDWIVNAIDGRAMSGRTGAPVSPAGTAHWVFAGSVTRQAMTESGTRAERYEADSEGTLIGFTTFGSELLAYSDILSPESGVDAPAWIADATSMPAVRTKVVVVLRPAPAR